MQDTVKKMEIGEDIANEFTEIHGRLRRLEKQYNPDQDNLHFVSIKSPDAELYSSILSLAVEGLRKVKKQREYFSRHPLYDDGMFWYDLFLLISSAAIGAKKGGLQQSIPDHTVRELIEILVEMSEYSTVHGGDITKRNYEALGNTLYAFYSQELIDLVSKRSDSISRVLKFIAGTLEEVQGIVQKEKSKSSSK